MAKNKNIIISVICLILFILIAYVYASPVLTGKQLFQHDIVQYKGGAKELLDYRAQYGEETYWSNSMFGGMPTYQMGAQFRGDYIKQIDNVLNFLPKPINYLFLLFSGFFLLGWVAVRNWKYALLGALFFGMSTYFYIIIAAGHNGKVHTIAYFAPLLAGILLIYIRKKYILGFIVTSLFMGLQIAANHPQMTYYLFLALGFLFISECVRVFLKKTEPKHFLISSGIIAASCVLGVGMNSQRIMANAEYVTETVRGKQILNNERHKSENSGMDKQSILMWSYGKLETLNLFIPRLMGGGSNEPEGEEIMENVQQLIQENTQSQAEFDNIRRGFSNATYWGDQPGTSGPAYQGAVVIFLAILGFFFSWKKYRYWILGASILTILLAWGSNFMILSDFFIDYVPFYNKFRAPSSILVVVELLLPLIAIIGLYRYFNDTTLQEAYKKKVVLQISAVTLAILILFIFFGKAIFGFKTDAENTYFPPYLLHYLTQTRFEMFKADAIKTFIYVAITAIMLWLGLTKKINQNIVLGVIALVSFFDLWTVNKRYLNDGNFVDSVFAEQPFQTEVTEHLVEKVGNNTELQGLLINANINKALETVSENDKGVYRIYNQTINTFGETNTSYFKSSIGGYHAVKLRRYDDLINHYFSSIDTVKVPRILNMLNTKYMVFGTQEEPQFVPNPNRNGNAWFVSDVEFVDTPNKEIERIGEIDNKKVAVISEKDKDYFSNKKLVSDSTAYLTLTKYKANELEYSSQSKTPQLAVFSEVYYPKGWKMFIDGKEVPYIKANYLLRAVHIPAGTHSIKMIFDPEVIAHGKIISIICFLIFVILSLLGIFFIFKKNKNQIKLG